MTINCDCDDTTGNRTLAQIRRSIIVLCGWAAVADNPPPGVADYVNEQLRLAHSLLWRRFPAIRFSRWFTWNLAAGERFYDLDGNAERGLGAPTAAPLLNGNVGGGTLPAGTYTYALARGNDDGETVPGPSAQVTLLATGSVEVFLPDPVPGQLYWYVAGRTDAGQYITVIDVADVDPLAPFWLDTGLYSEGSAVAATDGTATCSKTLDPYGVEEAWYDRDGQRTRMHAGLPSSQLARTTSGWPLHYDIRQCIEVWPAPSATEGALLIKGRFQTTAFAADDDVPGVPDDMVQLLALAATKSHYGKRDANEYVQKMEVLIADLIAGSHGTNRYVPDSEAGGDAVYVEPRPSEPF